MPTLQAIIFDLDGTLIDSLPYLFQALRETFSRYAGKTYSDDELAAMFGPTEPALIMQNVPETAADEAIQFYFERYEALHPQHPQPFPGVYELLHDLRTRGFKIGVVTGKSSVTADISMKAYGLKPLLDGLASGSLNWSGKPLAIKVMLAEWGIPPEQAAYVGDMWYDIEAARTAGVLPIGVTWAGVARVSSEDNLVFSSIRDFQNWLELTDHGTA